MTQSRKPISAAQTLNSIVVDLRERAISVTDSSSELSRGASLLKHADKDHIVALTAALSELPPIAFLRGGWLQEVDGGGHSFGDFLNLWLIERTYAGVPAEEVIDQALQIASSRTCEAELYSAVAGVEVREPISLRDDLLLLPWELVPESAQKTSFGKRAEALFQPFLLSQILPTAAIRITTGPRQVLFSSSEDVPAADRSSDASYWTTPGDVIHCMAVAAVASPRILGTWNSYRHPFVQSISGVSYSYSPATIFDHAVRSHSPVVDAAKLSCLFRSFENFKEREKPVLRVGINRFSAALRRDGLTNRAIDLGIALEVLLLHNLPPNDRGELTYRLSLRGSGILGGTDTERAENFRTLKDAYRLRSLAVHSGALDRKDERTRGTLDKAAQLCSRITCMLIKRGSFPDDWEREYVISR